MKFIKNIKVLKLGFCISLIFIFSTCQQGQKTNNKETTEGDVKEEAAEEGSIEEGFVSVDFESNRYKAIIKELKGIEKFYVQDDLFRLYSLLKFKNDERYQSLENDLKRKYENPHFTIITLIDNNNGYIEFHERDADIYYAIVYWNKTNGDKIIGETTKSCSMFCNGSIFFLLYDLNSQTYISKETSEIISDIDIVRSKLPDNHLEGEGYDSEFILPKKGKDIRYCVEQNCIDLIWKDGSFSVVEQ